MLRKYYSFVFLFILIPCSVNTPLFAQSSINQMPKDEDNSSDSMAILTTVKEDKTSTTETKSDVIKPEWINLKLGNLTETAFKDVFEILSKKNRCSDFYGESEDVLTVVNKLAQRIERKPLRDKNLGITMMSIASYFESAKTGFKYRMFKKVIINENGPFLNSYGVSYFPKSFRVGSYFPGTGKARTLMLLHELAHLIKNNSGSWLIPDDGDDYHLSKQNTMFIEKQCAKEIEKLK